MYAPAETYTDPDKCAKMVYDFFEWCKKNRTTREKLWRRNRLLYDNKTDLTGFKRALSSMPYEDVINIPTAFEKVEATMPLLCNALLTNNPMVRVKPRTDEDRAATMAVQALLGYQFEEDLDIRHMLPLLIRDACIYDTKIAYVGWSVRTHKAGVRFDPHTGKQVPPTRRELNKTTQRPERVEKAPAPEGYPELISIVREDFYADPWGKNMDHCRAVVWRRTSTPEQFKEFVENTREITHSEADNKGIEPREGKKWNMTNVRALLVPPQKKGSTPARATISDGMLPEDEPRLKRQQEAGSRGNYSRGDHDDRLIEWLDYYEDAVHCIVAGHTGQSGAGTSGPLSLLREPNPFDHGKKPFLAFRYVEMADQFDGKALLDVIRGLCIEKNTRRQQRMDEITRSINCWLFYNAAQIKGGDLVNRTMGKVPVRGNPQSAVHFEQRPPVNPQAYQESGMIDNEIDKVSGIGANIAGTAIGDSETARGRAMMIQQGTARFSLAVEFIARVLKKLTVMVHELDRQFLPAEGATRILGEKKDGGWKFEPWTLTDINRNFDFEFTASPEEANQSLWRQNLTNALAVIAEPSTGILDWREIDKAVFESLGYKGDTERFFLTVADDADMENAKFLKEGTFGPASETDPEIIRKHIQTHTQMVTDGRLAKITPNVKPEQAMQRLRAHLADHGQKLDQATQQAQAAQQQTQQQGAA